MRAALSDHSHFERPLSHVHEIPVRDFRISAAGASACRPRRRPPTSPGPRKSARAISVQIGNTRIRLGGIDAPSVDQLCLNNTGERWTCGVAARDELIKHADNKSWTCHVRQAVADRRGRIVARCEVDGEDIQKWLVTKRLGAGLCAGLP